VLEALARSVYSGLAWVRRHPLFAFLVGAFAFSWGDWLSLAATGERIAPGRLPTDMAGMAGPAFAAFAVAAIGRGEAGVRALALRLVRIPWRSAWFWILAPSPLWIVLATLAALALAGRPVPPLAAFARYPGLPAMPLLLTFDLVLLGVGFGQEIGWRGLALPRMQARFGPLSGAILLAVPWGAWLLPLLAVYRAGLPPGASPLPLLVRVALLLVASSVVLAFVVARTEGSLAAAALWHALLRMAVATDGGRGTVGTVLTMAVVGGAVALVVAEALGRRRGRSLLAFEPPDSPGRKPDQDPAQTPT
jgi:membrane protease YdiL (CAAX protease family)